MNPKDHPRWLLLLAYALLVIAIANFVAYVTISEFIGGDAINGTFKAGHYYLGGKQGITEVSRGVWVYSKTHTIAVWVTHGLLIGSLCYITFVWRARKTAQPKN